MIEDDALIAVSRPLRLSPTGRWLFPKRSRHRTGRRDRTEVMTGGSPLLSCGPLAALVGALLVRARLLGDVPFPCGGVGALLRRSHRRPYRCRSVWRRAWNERRSLRSGVGRGTSANQTQRVPPLVSGLQDVLALTLAAGNLVVIRIDVALAHRYACSSPLTRRCWRIRPIASYALQQALTTRAQQPVPTCSPLHSGSVMCHTRVRRVRPLQSCAGVAPVAATGAWATG